jgi:hypothetical protein
VASLAYVLRMSVLLLDKPLAGPACAQVGCLCCNSIFESCTHCLQGDAVVQGRVLLFGCWATFAFVLNARPSVLLLDEPLQDLTGMNAGWEQRSVEILWIA